MADICFKYVPTGRTVTFKDIVLDTFSDQLQTSLEQEKAFGRMDPMITYQGTTRVINLSFTTAPIKQTNTDVLLVNKYNFRALGEFMKLQYPVYEETNIGNALAIKAPPVFKVKLSNYIQDTGESLLCFIEGVSFTLDDPSSLQSMPTMLGGAWIPRKFTLNLTLHVLHSKPVGWSKGRWQGGHHWPFFNDELVKKTGGSESLAAEAFETKEEPAIKSDQPGGKATVLDKKVK